jgi:hypothetical protein
MGLRTTSVWMFTGKTIDYCVKDASGRIYAAGSIRATRLALYILTRKNGLIVSAEPHCGPGLTYPRTPHATELL